MNQPTLPMEFPEVQQGEAALPTRPADVRVVRPVRNQAEMLVRDLDSLVAEDHPVRLIWAFLSQLDLSAFYAAIKAVVDRPGRPAADPRVLLALWVYATVEGVGSARRLDRLCHEHDAYRWLRGNVPVDYHLLSDFRVAHQKALEALLTQIVASMMAQDLVQLNRVAQDGVKVRASAGAASFRRKDRLERCLLEAEAQVQRLAKEREHPDPEVSARETAARERAAKERVARVEAALRHMPALAAAKERQERTLAKEKRKRVTEPRVSTTDPEARVMKMADGGYRPAYNVQFATDAGSGMIVGVGVVNQGNDSGQAPPMEDQVAQRSRRHPKDYLVDGGYAQRETITTFAERGITLYAPVRPPRTATSGRQEDTPRAGDTPAVMAWRERMQTDEAKAIYRQRGATAEWANAQTRTHGLIPFTVRGLDKVLSVTLLVVLTHNLLRWAAIG